MKSNFSRIISIAFLSAIIGFSFSCVSFLTSNWVETAETQIVAGNETTFLSYHGLWDQGLADLNCVGVSIHICMPTRAFLLASLSVNLPAILCLATSFVTYISQGSKYICCNSSRISCLLSLVAAFNHLIGLALFTFHHNQTSTNFRSYGFSYYLSWASFLLTLLSSGLSLTFSQKYWKKFGRKKFSVMENDGFVPDLN